MSKTRTERDSFGPIEVPADRYWGAHTQRSLQNFKIGGERMPPALIHALGMQKQASALANMALGVLDKKIAAAIAAAAAEVAAGSGALGASGRWGARGAPGRSRASGSAAASGA